jgi:uncharacterized membrane protein YphA (DoxX/SURF4 family)
MASCKLNDIAITLFTDEFTLHCRAVPYPAPMVMAFLSGVVEIALPILLVLSFATRFAGDRRAVHDFDCRIDRARRPPG